jgi:selenocysteine lyase/cysteine desulfurase
MKQPNSFLENYFAAFAENIIGNHQPMPSPFGEQEILYADWTASGRAYQPIESFIQKKILPFAGNTHTAGNYTGKLMSTAYAQAKMIVKQHVHAAPEDALIFCGSGMTHAVNKLQRILGLRVPEPLGACGPVNPVVPLAEDLKPVVFVTHMEHHSNQTSWLETIATVIIIPPDPAGNTDLNAFAKLLGQYRHRLNKIAAVTACSNVTGIQTPYRQIAKMIHAQGGYCFVDFACSAPYVQIDMHPSDKEASLDAVYFSGHKFLGGPGTPGVLIFNKKLYRNRIPDQPGGGTLLYSNPWQVHVYLPDIEEREDGGTPPFLGAIKLAMCVSLKEAMGVEPMLEREQEINAVVFERFSRMENAKILAANYRKRLGVFSFIVPGMHHDLFVKILSDRFGVQARSGCSCAGTYGHYLLDVDRNRSDQILQALQRGDSLCKPGWIRLSIHPTMSNAVVHRMMDAVEQTILHQATWSSDYRYDQTAQAFVVAHGQPNTHTSLATWFSVPHWKNGYAGNNTRYTSSS